MVAAAAVVVFVVMSISLLLMATFNTYVHARPSRKYSQGQFCADESQEQCKNSLTKASAKRTNSFAVLGLVHAHNLIYRRPELVR